MTNADLDRLVEAVETAIGREHTSWGRVGPRLLARAFADAIDAAYQAEADEMHRAHPAGPDPLDCDHCGASIGCCDCEDERIREYESLPECMPDDDEHRFTSLDEAKATCQRWADEIIATLDIEPESEDDE